MNCAGFGGAELAYELEGEGTPALVFVHGWSCDASYWAGQVGAFSTAWPVVTLDLAGHGRSSAGERDWSIAAFGADVAAVVDALALERVILIGHSMSGDVILEAARRLPGRVNGLVWVDSHTQLARFRTSEQVQERLAPFREDFRAAASAFVRGMFPPQADAALVERVVAAMSAAPAAIALPTLASAMNYVRDVPGVLRELRLPVIAINPDAAADDIKSMERCGVEVMSMSGVGHFPMLEDPGHFNRLLRTAIARLSGQWPRST